MWVRPSTAIEKYVVAFGCIIRNAGGRFFAAKGISLKGLLTLKDAEVNRSLWSIDLDKNLGVDNVQIEMDALQVHQSIESS